MNKLNLVSLVGLYRSPVRVNCLRLKHTVPPTTYKEIEIPVPWGHVAGKFWGNIDGKPVLALHGWQDNANSFDPLIPLLNLESVCAIDFPGHGYSSHIPQGKAYDFEENLVVLRRIIQFFGTQKACFIGHSYGSCLAYVYSSIFPTEVKWMINIECARTLLSLFRENISLSLNKMLSSYFILEDIKKGKPPAYDMKTLLLMQIAGSLGSVFKPEPAINMIKRHIAVADEDKSVKAVQQQNIYSTRSDLFSIIDSKRFQSHIDKELEVAKEYDIQDALLYVFTRDLLLKTQMYETLGNDNLIKCSMNIRCPVLSFRAKNGFLLHRGKEVYEKTLEILKSNCKYLEHHEIEGTHHVHLNNPDALAPIINDFIEKID